MRSLTCMCKVQIVLYHMTGKLYLLYITSQLVNVYPLLVTIGYLTTVVASETLSLIILVFG